MNFEYTLYTGNLWSHWSHQHKMNLKDVRDLAVIWQFIFSKCCISAMSFSRCWIIKMDIQKISRQLYSDRNLFICQFRFFFFILNLLKGRPHETENMLYPSGKGCTAATIEAETLDRWMDIYTLTNTCLHTSANLKVRKQRAIQNINLLVDTTPQGHVFQDFLKSCWQLMKDVILLPRLMQNHRKSYSCSSHQKSRHT